jgi:hypothetical protein
MSLLFFGLPQTFTNLVVLQLACLTAHAWVQAPGGSTFRRHVPLQAEAKSRREAVAAGFSVVAAVVVVSTPVFAEEEALDYPENPVFRDKVSSFEQLCRSAAFYVYRLWLARALLDRQADT